MGWTPTGEEKGCCWLDVGVREMLLLEGDIARPVVVRTRALRLTAR